MMINMKTLKCAICGFKTKNQSVIERHFRKHPGYTEGHLHGKYQCRQCAHYCRNDMDLDMHMRAKHNGENDAYKCTKCKECFPSRNQLKKHMNAHREGTLMNKPGDN